MGRAGRTVLIVCLAAFFALVGLGYVAWSTGFRSTNCIRGSQGVPAGFSRGVTPGFVVRSNGCTYSPGYGPWMILGLVIGAALGVALAVGITHLVRASRRTAELVG